MNVNIHPIEAYPAIFATCLFSIIPVFQQAIAGKSPADIIARTGASNLSSAKSPTNVAMTLPTRQLIIKPIRIAMRHASQSDNDQGNPAAAKNL
jgi:hypothetical protein